jgi:solute carrier family 50 protein (sugar transporter)
MSYDTRKRAWGFTANAILLVYYAAPLSTIITVVRTRNSASLHMPLSIMNTINGVLWLVYGLAVNDLFIAVPNGAPQQA